MAIEARWVDLEDAPVVFVNQALGQVDQEEVFLTFGRLIPPPLSGPREKQEATIRKLKFLAIKPHVRFALNIDRLREFRDVLDETIAIYERQKAPRRMRRERDG